MTDGQLNTGDVISFGVVFAEKKASQSAVERFEELIIEFKESFEFELIAPHAVVCSQ